MFFIVENIDVFISTGFSRFQLNKFSEFFLSFASQLIFRLVSKTLAPFHTVRRIAGCWFETRENLYVYVFSSWRLKFPYYSTFSLCSVQGDCDQVKWLWYSLNRFLFLNVFRIDEWILERRNVNHVGQVWNFSVKEVVTVY